MNEVITGNTIKIMQNIEQFLFFICVNIDDILSIKCNILWIHDFHGLVKFEWNPALLYAIWDSVDSDYLLIVHVKYQFTCVF